MFQNGYDSQDYGTAMNRERFPHKKLMLSEACIEYSKFDAEDHLKNAQKYAHDMIGNLNRGMNAFCDWNLILDEQGGSNHVGNFCDAPYLYDTRECLSKEIFWTICGILPILWKLGTCGSEPAGIRTGWR